MLNLAEEATEEFRSNVLEFALEQVLRLYYVSVMIKASSS
jgi:hypothetical protein